MRWAVKTCVPLPLDEGNLTRSSHVTTEGRGYRGDEDVRAHHEKEVDMSRRRLVPLLSICVLLATGALYASGALASSVGDGVTLCAKGGAISYSHTGTCKSSETPLVLAGNGDAQALEGEVAALQAENAVLEGQVADLEVRVAAIEGALGGVEQPTRTS